MRKALIVVTCFLGWSVGAIARADEAAEVQSLLARIKSVGKEGAGHVEAMKAWKELAGRGPTVLPLVLAGLDDASPLAANWIRSAYEVIADRGRDRISPPVLEAFLNDQHHSGAARRLAYETLVRLDPKTPDRLLPGMLEDSGSELRRDAVERVLQVAQKQFDAGDKDAARETYRKAFKHARERDQVTLIGDRLKKLGDEVDLVRHFGFVTRWAFIGPFENSKGVGFGTVYAPELGIDLKAEHVGKDGKKVRWREVTSEKGLGIVDFNTAIGALHGVVGYGYAVIQSAEDRPVEVRCGSNNAVRIFLNGKEIFFREEYHHGMAMDQHVGKGILKAGRNALLIKVCQNEQKDSWAQQWSFQLRLCDSLGGAVPFTVVTEKISN